MAILKRVTLHFMMDVFPRRNIFFAVLFALTFCSASVFSQETVRLTNGEWPPFMSKSAPHHGLASHIVTSAFATQGIKVKYEWFPWKRAYALAADGEFNGCVGYTWSEERAKHFLYSDPIFELKDVFFHRKDFPFEWNTFEDLKGLTVGITHGYFYGSDFEEAKNKGVFQTDVAHSDELGLRKLLAKRIDVFPLATEIGYAMARKIFPDSQADLITNHPKPIRISKYCLILNQNFKTSMTLINSFNQGLKKLKENGQYEKFYTDLLSGGYESKQ